MDRDRDADLLVRIDPIQVEVPGIIRHRMHVHDLGDDRLGLVAVLQGYQVTLELAGMEGLAEFIGLHGNGNGILAAAVQHTGDHASAARGASATGADAATDVHVQNDLGHRLASTTQTPR